MSDNQQAIDQESASLISQALRPRSLAVAVGLILTGVGLRLGWDMLRVELAGSPEYRLSTDTVVLLPESPPAWIRADIEQEVFRDSGLADSLSLLDEPAKVQQRLVDAFELHPWIREVTRIDLVGPGRVEVAVNYREPVAVVQNITDETRELLPVDAEGVRLPEADLTEVEKMYLPRISGIQGRPLVGAGWSDQRTLGAVALAAQLRGVWQSLHLLEIVPSQYPDVARTQRFYVYDLQASGGTTIRWGAAPGGGPAGESSFQEKLNRLTSYVQQHGGLDTIDSPQVIDVRSTLRVEQWISKQPDEEELKVR